MKNLVANRKRLLAIALGIVLGVGAVLGIGVAVRRTTSSAVMVVQASGLNYGGGYDWENSVSGVITTDAEQSIYLSDSEVVSEVLVSKGQAVHKGDVLLRYDITTTALNLEKEKIAREKILLDLEVARANQKTLNSITPESDDDFDLLDDFEDFDDEAAEEEMFKKAKVHKTKLTNKAKPANGSSGDEEEDELLGTEDYPYIFLCEGDEITIMPSFIAKWQKFARKNGMKELYIALEKRDKENEMKLEKAWIVDVMTLDPKIAIDLDLTTGEATYSGMNEPDKMAALLRIILKEVPKDERGAWLSAMLDKLFVTTEEEDKRKVRGELFAAMLNELSAEDQDEFAGAVALLDEDTVSLILSSLTVKQMKAMDQDTLSVLLTLLLSNMTSEQIRGLDGTILSNLLENLTAEQLTSLPASTLSSLLGALSSEQLAEVLDGLSEEKRQEILEILMRQKQEEGSDGPGDENNDNGSDNSGGSGNQGGSGSGSGSGGSSSGDSGSGSGSGGNSGGSGGSGSGSGEGSGSGGSGSGGSGGAGDEGGNNPEEQGGSEPGSGEGPGSGGSDSGGSGSAGDQDGNDPEEQGSSEPGSDSGGSGGAGDQGGNNPQDQGGSDGQDNADDSDNKDNGGDSGSDSSDESSAGNSSGSDNTSNNDSSGTTDGTGEDSQQSTGAEGENGGSQNPSTAPSPSDDEEDDSESSGSSGSSGSGLIASDATYTSDELAQEKREITYTIKGLELDLRESDIRIRKAERAIEEGEVKATLNGVIKTVGNPADPPKDGSAFLTLLGSDGLFVKSAIRENLLTSLGEGDKVTVTSWMDGMTYDAVIGSVSPYPDNSGMFAESDSNTYYPFTAVIQNKDADLHNGDWVEVSYTASGGWSDEEESDELYLWKAFVRDENGRKYVYMRGEDGKLHKQYIQTGELVDSGYRIISGLSGDDWIAFPYGSNAAEGARTREATLDEIYR